MRIIAPRRITATTVALGVSLSVLATLATPAQAATITDRGLLATSP